MYLSCFVSTRWPHTLIYRRSVLELYHAAEDDDEELARKRDKLNTKIDAWRQEQLKWMPTVRKLVEEDDSSDNPEALCLHLPSDFSELKREELNLTELAGIEMSLREGQAYDLLDELRQQLKINTMLQIDKQETVWGTRAGNRSLKAINEAHRLKRYWMSEYKAVREAMIALGLDITTSHFKILTEKDLYRNSTVVAHTLGSGTKPDGWVWTIGKGSGSKTNGKLDEGEIYFAYSRRSS